MCTYMYAHTYILIYIHTMWARLVTSCFIAPPNYGHFWKYHKPRREIQLCSPTEREIWGGAH